MSRAQEAAGRGGGWLLAPGAAGWGLASITQAGIALHQGCSSAVGMEHLSQRWIAPHGPFWGLSFVSPCVEHPGKSWRAQAELRAVNDGTEVGL